MDKISSWLGKLPGTMEEYTLGSKGKQVFVKQTNSSSLRITHSGPLHPPDSPVTQCSLAWLAGTDFQVATITPPHKQHLCHSACHCHSTTMDPDTCQATYLLGLSKTHALHEQSVAAKTVKLMVKHTSTAVCAPAVLLVCTKAM